MTRINTPGQSIIELIVFPSTKMRENDNNKATMTALLSTYERAYVFIDVMLCDKRAVFSVCVCVSVSTCAAKGCGSCAPLSIYIYYYGRWW